MSRYSTQQLVDEQATNLTRFHGVFAPNSRHPGRVTKARRGRGGRHALVADPEAPTAAERLAAMAGFAPAKPAYMPSMAISWAQRLKRVFGIDIETCRACGGSVRIIASIEDPKVIEKILTHLAAQAGESETPRRPPTRAPPQARLFD